MNADQQRILAQKLSKLSPEQRAKLAMAVRKAVPTVRRNKYMPKTLAPKQEAFLGLNALEVLFGGAAGGGKSSSLLMGALQYADLPNYDALILRRTFLELNMPGAIMNLSHKWLQGTDARWRNGSYWEFPSGATLRFGYLARDDDKWQYGSAKFNYIAFDEAAEFPFESTYTFLFSRLRREEGVAIPPRIRLGANPIGPGASWLKARFITAPSNEKLRYEPCLICEHIHWDEHCDGCGCEKNPNSEPRIYVPSRLSDNPFLDAASYRRSLAQLDTYTREALENGNWDAKPPGKMFRREWFKLTPNAPQSINTVRVRFWDLAATQEEKNNPSYTCGVKMAYDNGKFYVEHVVRVRETPGAVKRIVQQTAQMDGRGCQIFIEQEPGSSGIAVIDDYIRTMPNYAVRAHKLSGSKNERAAPLAVQAEHGNVSMVEGAWNDAYLSEMEQFPSAQVKNDQVDASSGAYNVLAEKAVLDLEGLASYGDRIQPDWHLSD